MLYLAVILFLTAALFGIFMLSRWLKVQGFPKDAIFAHGAIAAAGIIILIIYAVQNPSAFPLASIVLFVIAATGGAYMAFRDIMQKKPPIIPLAIVHSLLAVSGVIALLFFVLS